MESTDKERSPLEVQYSVLIFNLTDETGADLARKALEMGFEEGPVVVCTDHRADVEQSLGDFADKVTFVEKPFTLTGLVDAVEQGTNYSRKIY
jgi:FixJ family two-component response regulator